MPSNFGDFSNRKMTITLLFDLDGTLLMNTVSEFIPAYLNLLGNFLGKDQSSQEIQSAVLTATNLMVHNNDPARTLEECFDDYFYSKIKTSKKDLLKDILDFYENNYPQLKKFTSPFFEVKPVINNFVQMGISLIIATNPLFPKTAITQRVKWANLDPKINEYTLITSYEAFHFAKPNPAYFAEILAKLGWPEGPIGMVGNDWEMDILPAEVIGIPTYFLGKPEHVLNISRHPLSSQGNWEELEDWVKKISMVENHFEPNQSVDYFKAVLLSTAAVIDSFMRSHHSSKILSIRPVESEWSLVEIISHIADVDEEVNLPRINMILNDDTPFFPAIETDEWASERRYILNDPLKEMQRFISNRKNLVETISNLSNQDLSKLVNHSIFGPTSVKEIIKFITQHDRIHIQQINQTASKLDQNL
ncbi:MAG: DinB family protein [Anaerolineaceae bacterium]